MTIPRQLAPTVGPAHGGFEFLKGSFEGLKGYAVGRMTKSRRGKLYIDDANWGPDAGSIEYGYRVPFGGIHVFIGKIGEPGPEPDLCADLIETAQRARPARARPALRHAFVGCLHGGPSDQSGSGDEAAAGSDGESSTDESNSLYQLQDGRLMGCSDGDSISDPQARSTGLEYSWLAPRRRIILRLPQQCSPDPQRQRQQGQEALCARRFKFYLIYLIH